MKAVLFDVDFTLARPGPGLMPEGYVMCGERFGLALDAARYERARDAALLELQRHPELDHDEAIWIAQIFAAKDPSGKGANRIAFGKVFGKP